MSTMNCVKSLDANPITSTIIIDLNLLKNSHYLSEANILKKLFGLVEDDGIFCYKLNIKEGFATILKDFNIRGETWTNFIFYIKHGTIPEANLSIKYLIENNEKTNCLTKILKTLKEILDLTIKLGGVPKFEAYYKSFIRKVNNYYYLKKYGEYNPRNPQEDKYDRYIWSFYNSTMVYTHFISLHKSENGWSAVSTKNNCIWYRKKKNGSEDDISAIYTASEVEIDENLNEEQIEADSDTPSELQYDFDENEDNLEPWLDNDEQDQPYHTGW